MTEAPVPLAAQIRHTPEGVFLGHMLEVQGNDVALAREIFGECWAIGECHCLWVLAIRVAIGLILGPKLHVFDLWHVYGRGEAGRIAEMLP